MSALKVITNLFDSFHSNNIQYVHWKSNVNLDKALEGEDDLDILVSPNDEQKLYTVFSDLKIIRGYSEKDAWQKRIVHYYVLDELTASIVHIHLHFQLPIGYDYNKNFTLPVVEKVLAKRVLLHGVYISSPEHEYILLILRILIKNAFTPFLLSSPKTQIKLIKDSKIVTGSAYKEFLHLKNKVDASKLKESLENDFNFIDELIFRKCEATIEKNNSLKDFLKISSQLKKKLKPYRNKNEISSFIISFIRINKSRLLKVKRKFFGDPIKGTKLPEHGGRIFAFVGGDGAGKSTNISILKKNLSQNFKTTSIHIGKPPKSIIGFGLYYFSRVLQLMGIKKLGGSLMSMRLAIDRKRAYSRAEKLREKGIVVILDRIPLKGITAMDCPHIDSKKFPRLAKFERKKYKSIKGVGLLFVMKLNPEIALQRRPEDDPETLRIRSGQIWNGVWEYPYQIVIDTGELDFFQVEQRIMKEAWRNMVQPFKRMELVGISGTGKSTITEKFETLYSNVSKNLSLKDYPWQALKATIQYPKGAFCLIFSNRKNLPYRINFRINFLNSILLEFIKTKKSLNSHLILDQSIIFSYIIALKEGYITEKLLISEINKISDCFDFVVLLEASKRMLYERIKGREEQGVGRSKDMTFAEFCDFYDEYYSAFQVLGKTKLNLHKIDSSQTTPTEIAHTIMNQK